jgi:hypothetical protein
VSQIFTCGLSDLLLHAVGSLVVFVLREYILKVHITCFFKQIVDIFFIYKAYYQESNILIIVYIVVWSP